MNILTRHRAYNIIIHGILWLIVLVVPVIFAFHNGRVNWNRVLFEWLRMWPFMVVYLVNSFVLFRFLDQKKYTTYFVLAIVLVLVIGLIDLATPFIHDWFRPREPRPERPPIPGPDIIFEQQRYFNNIVISVLVIGLNDAIKIGLQWVKERRQFEQLEKENLKHQLAFLQHQISPHFFMNTLNNIHALIDYDSEEAKKSVVKLSKLMRVLLYESQSENYTLKREIEFLADYIELMRIRVSENVDIVFNHPVSIPNVKIAPLLFISFVENAFKHGVRAMGTSFIHIDLSISPEELWFRIVNSKAKKSDTEEEAGKIGLDNSAKRLDLLFEGKHSFVQNETDDTFEVFIKIPLL